MNYLTNKEVLDALGLDCREIYEEAQTIFAERLSFHHSDNLVGLDDETVRRFGRAAIVDLYVIGIVRGMQHAARLEVTSN